MVSFRFDLEALMLKLFSWFREHTVWALLACSRTCGNRTTLLKVYALGPADSMGIAFFLIAN